jgi:hypothetical protein
MEKLTRDMSLAGFDVAVRWNDRKTVHVAWMRVGGILKEAGISNIVEQKLSIKLEVDTRPPEGAILERRLVNRHMLLSLQHHDLPSLMAGKLHALVTRGYPKGRDWYDLAWYRAKRPPITPNLTLLQKLEEPSACSARVTERRRPQAGRRRVSGAASGCGTPVDGESSFGSLTHGKTTVAQYSIRTQEGRHSPKETSGVDISPLPS